MDKLEFLFETQKKLNDMVFAKHGHRAANGEPLTMERLIAEAETDTPKGVSSDTHRWLVNYLRALQDESRELGEEFPWKWWSKEHLKMGEVRMEIIDQLHFWLSLAMAAGLDAEGVVDLYTEKNRINIERQQRGYSAAQKAIDGIGLTE